ncbi:MAG: enoyl-CoA hydratase/isomerase family protein [Verrucomicrobia bacterium]|nr:enoyl-CoA hydratase/isomerase family protein [Verrucomicrobiota bacterium]
MPSTILQTRTPKRVTITLNRPQSRNALNRQMLRELCDAFQTLEADPDCSVVVLEGKAGFFCTGMDFEEFAADPAQAAVGAAEGELDSTYMTLLKAIAASSKVVVSVVAGQVLAGGVGLVAASDLVIATPPSTFGLPEALWGLLPACVTPFLIRRVGFHPAYKLALTTQNITAEEACRIGLVDAVQEAPEEILRRYLLRLSRLDTATIATLKSYFRAMWILDDRMERAAVEEINRLSRSPRVQDNIRNYQVHRKFPWEI